jgi:hypothetical protein
MMRMRRAPTEAVVEMGRIAVLCDEQHGAGNDGAVAVVVVVVVASCVS